MRRCRVRGMKWFMADARPTSAGAEPAVEIRGLTKRFGRVLALDNVDLAIPRTAVGLLGANGAGKTTLLRILLGLSTPTAGETRVLGFSSRGDGVRLREQVGFMPESAVLPEATTAADLVGHMAQMSGLPARAARQRAADVLYQVGLDEERYRLIKGLSTGMKQRVKLAQAIVHDPQLVFLDEPTIGMDPQGRDDMLALVDRIHRELGIAVIVSSHLLEDIERVCRYVVMLNEGRVVVAQPIADRQTSGVLRLRVDGDLAAFGARLAARGVAAERAATQHETAVGDELVIRLADGADYDVIRDAAADLGVGIRSMRVAGRSLEDLYLHEVQSGGDHAGA